MFFDGLMTKKAEFLAYLEVECKHRPSYLHRIGDGRHMKGKFRLREYFLVEVTLYYIRHNS